MPLLLRATLAGFSANVLKLVNRIEDGIALNPKLLQKMAIPAVRAATEDMSTNFSFQGM